MKIIVTGCNGQLGTEIIKQLQKAAARSAPSPKKLLNATVIAVDLPELDISNYKMVDEFVRRNRPDVIINCAAYTNVDGCEVNHDAAFKANALGPRNLAQAAKRLVHVWSPIMCPAVRTAALHRTKPPFRPHQRLRLHQAHGRKVCGAVLPPSLHRPHRVALYSYYGKTSSRPSSTRAKSSASWKWSTTSAATRPMRWIWPTRFYSLRHPRVRPVPLHRRGHLLVV